MCCQFEACMLLCCLTDSTSGRQRTQSDRTGESAWCGHHHPGQAEDSGCHLLQEADCTAAEIKWGWSRWVAFMACMRPWVQIPDKPPNVLKFNKCLTLYSIVWPAHGPCQVYWGLFLGVSFSGCIWSWVQLPDKPPNEPKFCKCLLHVLCRTYLLAQEPCQFRWVWIRESHSMGAFGPGFKIWIKPLMCCNNIVNDKCWMKLIDQIKLLLL